MVPTQRVGRVVRRTTVGSKPWRSPLTKNGPYRIRPVGFAVESLGLYVGETYAHNFTKGSVVMEANVKEDAVQSGLVRAMAR
jgi:hypothetical protein